ncbi:Glu/Leu/Phe/Val family dehydrogenase [Acetomicrobium hydrogeniformans]|jgi:glutamate dehydrogenase/leucine dehydrogenase|uniref:Glutamate dehydrogenase n=1 Tax=Acetomicrobium hydrogeniformans TaxID=649746 RepID=A0A7V6ZCS3_9BACT|nr:Glu/Leu/Phe/Val dehydrogenase [Acetomicrobium hydrogeniformans]HHZ03620.1 Glu/Leu/Phe/Val dehydrogenase [Acetomicrobium hydrogeniformans]
MKNVWETARYYLKVAAEAINLEPEITERLSTPMRFVEFTIPVRMDNGDKKLFVAYRSHHCDALGPCKDGTRVKPDLTPEEIKALSMFMSIKHAIGDIPAGGGKGGIKADPYSMSKGEYERLIRGFIRRLVPKGAMIDVPGADIGTGEEQMAWMLDEYEQITGMHSPAAINDKPVALGGSKGGYEATGRGVALCTFEACKDLGFEFDKTTVAIQGFGQVGSVTAKMLFEKGFKILCVSDIYGAIYDPKGINITNLLEYVKKTGKVVEFPGAQSIDSRKLFELDVDVLIPAAVQDVITEDNADRIKAKLVVEAANGPTTPEADAILSRKGIRLIPDVLANSGGAIVCHFERIQGLSNDWWEEEKVYQMLEKRILGAYKEISSIAQELKVTRRTAAWAYALRKIAEAMRLRGWS